MIYTLRNSYLSISVRSKGAELTSIKVGDKEYLWQGDAAYWKRQSPILFPIVGRLKDHEYVYRGKTYKLPQHGFARDNEFNVIEQSEYQIKFEQKETEETKLLYPFAYALQVTYTLKGKSVEVAYAVKNPSKSEKLYFSIGAHPAFNCPMEEGHKRNEYALIFDKALSPKNRNNEDGLFIDSWSQYFETLGILDISDTIFNNGAITFNPNPFENVSFVHQPTNKPYLSVSFKSFPYLGIWSSKKNAKFVCIEPWHGIADSMNHTKEFTEKEGVIPLQPLQTFSSLYTITVH